MEDVQLLRTPWEDELTKLATSAVRQVRICAPFVKQNAVRRILDATGVSVAVNLVSRFNTAYFHLGYSDTAAFREVLARRGRVRNCQRLHAKVYLFDECAAVVTSSNLTLAGLRRNWEYGVVLQDTELVAAVAVDFERLWDADEGPDIDEDVLDTIDQIVTGLPEAQPSRGLEVTPGESEARDEPELLLHDAVGVVANSLTGWKRAVFGVLNEMPGHTFRLADVYAYAPRLGAHYPDNTEVEAKIRQQLQFLRDLGLLEFLEPGRYKKLWT